MKRHFLIIAPVVIALLVLSTSPDFINKRWLQYRLDREFVCPEMQSEEEAESALYKYIKFYKDNFPEVTVETLLSMRMKLLVSHDCLTTLKNLDKNNSDAREY